jgi:hypothetical protein
VGDKTSEILFFFGYLSFKGFIHFLKCHVRKIGINSDIPEYITEKDPW